MIAATAALRCDGLGLRFGGIAALSDVTLDLRAAKVTAVMGPNGAGKTTLLNCLSGTVKRYSGSIRLGGKGLDGLSPRQRTRAGLVRTFQVTRVFPSLSIEENVFLAAAAADQELGEHGCGELVSLVGLDRMRRRPASELSGGQRRLLEIAVCLAQRPSFLLMDEPFAGLNPMMVNVVCHVMADAARAGAGIVLVSHEIPIVRRHADAVVVMAQGSVLAEGTPEEVLSDPRVVQSYLGGGVAGRQ